MTEQTWDLLMQGGGLTAFIGFSYLVLKAFLKQIDLLNRSQRALTEVLSNHFKADQEFMVKINESLTNICNQLKERKEEEI